MAGQMRAAVLGAETDCATIGVLEVLHHWNTGSCAGVTRIGIGMRRSIAIVGIVLGLAPLQPAQAQNPACGAINIVTCPSFYAERCNSDAQFRNQNASACVRIAAKRAVDKPECASIDLVRCDPKAQQKCADVRNPLDRFFCEKGHSTCPKSIPEIRTGYDRVLGEFNKALERYQPLLELDVRKVNDMQSLCGYSPDQLRDFQALAEQDREGLKRFDRDLNGLGTCSDTLQSFLQSGRPAEITEELWQQITTNLAQGITQVAARKGELKTKQEGLDRAPKQIEGLGVAHRIACEQKPSNQPNQPGRK